MTRSSDGARIARLLGRALLALAALSAAFLAVWAAVQGPVTVYRVIVIGHGDTTIDDHKLYPFRPLEPAPHPIPFAVEPNAALARIVVGGAALSDVLAESDSIAFLAAKDDRLLLERYFQGHGEDRISQVFSVSKSALSALIGAAIADGLIGSVDDPVTAYVPELAAAGFGRVRLVELLQMRSGMDYVENDNPFGEHVRFNFTPYLEREILALEAKPEPDASFRYKSGENALLGLVLERALNGETITAYTQRRLWDPLGMEHGGLWSLDREGGLERTWCCLSATARDLAKLGALYRDGGLWRGERLLPKAWIEASVRRGGYPPEGWPEADVTKGFWNYGYQWWLADRARGDFLARGKDGQYIYVDPRSGVVIVRLGYSLGERRGEALTTADWLALFQQVADKARAL